MNYKEKLLEMFGLKDTSDLFFIYSKDGLKLTFSPVRFSKDMCYILENDTGETWGMLQEIIEHDLIIKKHIEMDENTRKTLDALKVLGYNWIVRDEDNIPYAYVMKPKKINSFWLCNDKDEEESIRLIYDIPFLEKDLPYEI